MYFEDYDNKISVLAVVGPTATGKTRLAIRLAKMLDGAIISADSMQIYKNVSIGTNLPTKEELSGIPCYLINLIEPTDNYYFSVASFVEYAKDIIIKLHKLNKYPIICGGTGLYVDSLINNIEFFKDSKDDTIRRRFEEIYKYYGIEPLIKELSKVDQESLKKIHPNNVKRIIRSLEFYFTTGFKISDQVAISKIKRSIFKPTYVGLNYKNKENLKKAIKERTDSMLKKGLIDEVKNAIKKNYTKILDTAIGYKELLPYIRGEVALEDAVERLNINTRKYAKRQMTWFKRNEKIKWFYVDEYKDFENLYKDVSKYLKDYNCNTLPNRG